MEVLGNVKDYRKYSGMAQGMEYPYAGLVLNISDEGIGYYYLVQPKFSLKEIKPYPLTKLVTLSDYLSKYKEVHKNITQFYGNFLDVKTTFAVLIVWRFITYYLAIIVGGLLFSLEKKVKK